MAFPKKLAMAAALSTLFAAPALAQDINAAVAARQGQMQIIAYNLGLLGGMAKGEITYDAGMATAAAENVAAAAGLATSVLWPAGSDASAHPTTRAKAEIWSDMAGFDSEMDKLVQAAAAAAGTVGSGAEAIGPALGAIGGTCKACHEGYRGPKR